MSAPKPSNFSAMADAWQDPIAFSRELDAYYAELRKAGHSDVRPITEPSRGVYA